MILLLGGTTEASSIALTIAEAGYEVLVSTATDFPLELTDHHRIERRAGELDEAGMTDLISARRIRAVVDAAHPYAAQVHATARQSAKKTNIRYLAFIRPAGITQNNGNVVFARDHKEASQIACAPGQPVLLTTGSRNLSPYVAEAGISGSSLFVRVLPAEESLNACRKAGIRESCIVTGRGPFSVAENRDVIKRFNIGVLVTKDSGIAGGVREKMEAARLEGCIAVVVQRPALPPQDTHDNISGLIAALLSRVPIL